MTGALMPPQPVATHRPGSLAIAVVNTKRLLTELLPDRASPEDRAQIMQDIQQAVSYVATTHNLDLVFDSSGRSINDAPMIPSAGGVADITEEVRQELAK